ncbi:hypothetical protein M8I35_10470 [Micromonospora sp. MSM11]|nr:hypothetical protein [Micromonospora sp. MSM11]MCL7457606.1 hypothetical protein [Micromonospora sp. MSM11]
MHGLPGMPGDLPGGRDPRHGHRRTWRDRMSSTALSTVSTVVRP